jgi:hypothetical protein
VEFLHTHTYIYLFIYIYIYTQIDMILYIYNVFLCETRHHLMPYIISPVSKIIIDLMMARSQQKHVAVNKLIESVFCVCERERERETVFIHPCDLLTPTGMSYLKTEKYVLVTQLHVQVCRSSELLRCDKLRNICV